MQKINNLIARVHAATLRESGQGTVEYVMVTGLIAVVAVGLAVTGVGGAISDAIDDVAGDISAAFA